MLQFLYKLKKSRNTQRDELLSNKTRQIYLSMPIQESCQLLIGLSDRHGKIVILQLPHRSPFDKLISIKNLHKMIKSV